VVLFRPYKQFILLALLAVFCNCGENGSKSSFSPHPVLVERQEVTELALGQSCPDFALYATDGTLYRRDDFDDDEILIVVFLSNHCPESQNIENQLVSFQGSIPDGVAMIGISGNSPIATPLDRLGYSDLDDSYDSMKERVVQKGFNFPYLYDGDDQAVSLKFGPQMLPTAYVFDGDRRLYAKTNFLRSDIGRLSTLISDILSGTPMAQGRDMEVFGCPVHWSWESKEVEEEVEEWRTRQVLLHQADINDLAKILSGDPHYLKVINFWATWCGPCKKEFPDFLKISRQFQTRPVQFITISVDGPEKQDEAFDFLNQVHAPLQNYILNDVREDSVRAAIGQEWDGSIPLTLLIGPSGMISKRWSGPFNQLELKRSIVRHPFLQK